MNKKEYQRNYQRKYARQRQLRFRKGSNCINCGMPCKPYWRCKKHRLMTSKANKRYYQKKVKDEIRRDFSEVFGTINQERTRLY